MFRGFRTPMMKFSMGNYRFNFMPHPIWQKKEVNQV